MVVLHNTTTESVLTARGLTSNTCVCCATGPPPVGSSPAAGDSQAGIGSMAISTFNGRQYYTDRHDVHVLTDACRTASGCFWAGDWHYSVFHADWPKVTAMHINYKEVCAVAPAVGPRWSPLWAGRTVVVHTDSAVTKAILNKGRSQNAFINDVLRAVSWRSVTSDFELRAIHVPGSLTGIPDAISRLHETATGETGAVTVVLAPRPSAPRPHRGPHVVAFVSLSVSTGAAKKLETALQAEVARYRGKPLLTILKELTHPTGTLSSASSQSCVCRRYRRTKKTIAMYAACLAGRLRPATVRQYLNRIVRVMHLEAGLSYPLKGSWFISST